MAHVEEEDAGIPGVIPVGKDKGKKPVRNGFVAYMALVPGFAYLLILYAIGFWLFRDPRANLIELGPFRLSWVEVVLFLAAIVACTEILKVSEPGVNNSSEVLLMGLVAVIQFGLIVASLYDDRLAMFKTTESMEMLMINAVQTVVAFQVNSRSLLRTLAPSGTMT